MVGYNTCNTSGGRLKLLGFAAKDPGGYEFHTYDIDSGVTKRVADINPGPADSDPGNMFSLGCKFVFTADDGTHGRELWRYDSTGNACLVRDLRLGTKGSNPKYLTVHGDRIYYRAYREDVGNETWWYK